MTTFRMTFVVACVLVACGHSLQAQSGTSVTPAAPSFTPSNSIQSTPQIFGSGSGTTALPPTSQAPFNTGSFDTAPTQFGGAPTQFNDGFSNSGFSDSGRLSGGNVPVVGGSGFGQRNYGDGPSFQQSLVPGCCGQKSFYAPTSSVHYRAPNYGSGFCYGRAHGRPLFGRWSGF